MQLTLSEIRSIKQQRQTELLERFGRGNLYGGGSIESKPQYHHQNFIGNLTRLPHTPVDVDVGQHGTHTAQSICSA